MLVDTTNTRNAIVRRRRQILLRLTPCILCNASCDCTDNPAYPYAQNLFRKRISKLKLFVLALNVRVDACSYCAMNDRRSETRYSRVSIWFGSEVTFVE